MSAKVVQFPNIPTSDMPGSLRFLADWLEKNPDAATKMVIITDDDDDEALPVVYGYGQLDSKADVVYTMELAKHGLLHYSEVIVHG